MLIIYIFPFPVAPLGHCDPARNSSHLPPFPSALLRLPAPQEGQEERKSVGLEMFDCSVTELIVTRTRDRIKHD